jgi:hypothetical protein
MDTRKLEILKSDKKAYLSLNKPGEGGTIIANMDLDGIYKPEDMRELVKRWNAYPELIETMENLLRYCVTTKGLPDTDKGRTEDQQAALLAARIAIANATKN